ncbi:MAG: ABC transporter permease [Clostridia bacterium]|nr:ABC transporter permease [Clostridia bacterium]MBP3648699.1 ABC transporter permease [Clostridia bacterium]
MSETTNNNKQNLALDDGRRVKVLSPGMMVFKRFIRNRLAIAGICILVFMFAFSFLGGIISPYRQDQVFYKYDYANKEYAGAVVNTEYRYLTRDGSELPAATRAKFTLAAKADAPSFEAGGTTYSLVKVADGFFRIGTSQELGTVAALGKIVDVKPAAGVTIDEELKKAAVAAVTGKQSTFELNGVTYTLTPGKAKSYTLAGAEDIALASMLAYDAYSTEYSELINNFDFRLLSETAMHNGETSFELDGVTYHLDIESETTATISMGEGDAKTMVANVSNVIVNPVNSDMFLPMDYKAAVTDAIAAHESSFEYVNADGETEKHTIQISVNNYVISTDQKTMLIDMYAFPSKNHWLGTDDHGMDVLTRLMYGGRISLMVGFIVVFLELLIGIVIGGVSGYFGGWVDTLLMRFVDLFNSIPYYPMMIIAGALMDAFEVNPYTRIFMLMGIMGIMGWTGIARTVRGQILSLREQDFMVATEATGIRISRRIFRHLVPNVMPLLIVQATMSLGSIILTEATLSFLGLGIKYPLASWGTIINSASNIYVMSNFWFIWIPAGILIVLTVLGFNFVGDGLRDAFDPKMKR